MSISIDVKGLRNFLKEEEIERIQPMVELAHKAIEDEISPYSKYLGWVEVLEKPYNDEISKIKMASNKIRNSCEVFLVVGIGGSYLGGRAAIEMLSHSFYNSLTKEKRGTPEIYFVGNNISSTYMADLIELIEDKDICMNVISKSGSTIEPAIAFRVLKDFLEKKYGKKEAKERIFVTTDKENGILKNISEVEGYESFVIRDDIGGRFSVLTAVGLLPIAVAGIDIDKIIEGAREAYRELSNELVLDNSSYTYSAIRNILYSKGKTIEILASYEPCMHYFCEWWKQLFGESEGKEGKGIFPTTAQFSTDLHSLGQYIQEGRRCIFETVIQIEKPKKHLYINECKRDLDGLNYIKGEDMHYINEMSLRGTMMAHNDGGVPNILITVPELSPHYFGFLVYFFEKACAVSGYLLGVNPFDQPGVEAYKKNMQTLINAERYKKIRAIT